MAKSSLSVLPADWSAILARMQHEINQSIATIAMREDALRDCGTPIDGDALHSRLAACRDRSTQFDEWVARASEQVSDIDTALRGGEETLRGWLSAVAATRERLAKWANGGIG